MKFICQLKVITTTHYMSTYTLSGSSGQTSNMYKIGGIFNSFEEAEKAGNEAKSTLNTPKFEGFKVGGLQSYDTIRVVITNTETLNSVEL